MFCVDSLLFVFGRQGPGLYMFCDMFRFEIDVFRCMYQNHLCKMMSFGVAFFFNTNDRYISWSQNVFYVCCSSCRCSLWSSAFIVVVLVNMTSNNGLCVSLICQDRSVAMGCGSHMHGVSCGAVFAAEVAVLFLRGADDASTLLSPPVIESILTSAAKVVTKEQSMGKLAASPF